MIRFSLKGQEKRATRKREKERQKEERERKRIVNLVRFTVCLKAVVAADSEPRNGRERESEEERERESEEERERESEEEREFSFQKFKLVDESFDGLLLGCRKTFCLLS